jgi:3-oxoacyl-[acyl-carrier protein] reductase
MRRALVTGAASGLGAAVAHRLRADGIEVVTLDLTGKVDVHADVSDDLAVVAAVRNSGPIDVLVNSAGVVGPNKLLTETTPDEWRRTFEVNVLGTVATMRATIPGMVERGWGRVVNIASMAAKDGNPKLAAYSATKAAVIALTKSAGKELATTGVLVNAIAPGVINTPMNSKTAPDVLEYITSLIPMKRAGTAEEVADISGGRATY